MNNTKISYLSRNQYQYLGHLVAAYYSFIDPDKNERLMIELAGWHADLQRTVYIFVKRHRQSYDIIYVTRSHKMARKSQMNNVGNTGDK